ncbi:PAS domain-containing protein [Methylobacter luteus]|uniref:PAS domain-containing protein n=1 Tax=Methylobacter luteus TaxID=415 RepID=UPI000423CF93|nr:PAS domain-containing protein [Methylobacter luteus]
MKRWIRLLALPLAWAILSFPGFVNAEQQSPLSVGSSIGFPPYADIDDRSQAIGFTVELFTAVSAVMDIPVTFQPDRWGTVWQKLKTGEIDALPIVARMLEREDQVEFTEPHTIAHDSFFVRKGRDPIKFIEQARTLSIIVLRSDVSHEALASRGFNQQLVLVDSLTDGFRLLASGHYDAVLAPLLQGNALVHNIGLEKIVTPGPLLKEYRREFCFAVRKGDTELRDRLNQGLAIVKASGEYDRLYRKWLSIYETPSFPVKYVVRGALAAAGLLTLLGLWTWQLRRQVELRTDELAQAYTAVQAERQRLHDVLQALPVYVILLSQDYQVTFANRFFAQRYGKSLGRSCYNYLFNRNKPCAECETFKVFETHTPQEWQWTGPDDHDYEIHDFPFTDTDGSPMIMEVGIDITEMKRAKQALREANASLEQRVAERTTELEAARHEAEEARDLLQITMDNAPALMSYIDRECRYLRVNKNYELWFGYTPEQVCGHHMRDVIGEPAWQTLGPYLERVLAGEQVEFEHQVPFSKGGPRWVHATYSPDVDADGQVRGFVVHEFDISERKEAEEALVKAHALLDGLLAQAPVGFAYLDRELRHLLINDKLAALNGLPAAAHIGQRIHDIVPPLLLPVVEKAVDRMLMTGKPVKNHEISGETPSMPGVRRYWNANWYPLYDNAAEITGFGVIVEEITERKQAEEALHEADRRKDEFLAMLAHELRNPLAPISNAVQIMKRPNLDETRLAWCRDVIGRQVEHLVRLVDDLLDVSRISRGKIELKKEPLAVSTIVQRAVETSQPLIDVSRHEFSVHLPPEPVYVEGDLVRLSQVVSNLLNNAAKYTDAGGCISLSVEPADDEIFIRVRDNGRGIESSALSSLFQLFYQVDRTIDRAEGGLGIGLSLVKSLVTMHGGEVGAYSEGRGQGSEFVIRLPCLRESPAAPVSYPADSKPDEGSLRILVVDDNRDAAQSLSLLLNSEGHEVLQANDGYTALETALAERPQVVLLDIGLPGMDGYAVARALRQHPALKMTHLIALSGYGRAMDREQAKTAGFNDYLTKPVNFDELLCALAQPSFPDQIPI